MISAGLRVTAVLLYTGLVIFVSAVWWSVLRDKGQVPFADAAAIVAFLAIPWGLLFLAWRLRRSSLLGLSAILAGSVLCFLLLLGASAATTF